MAALMEEEEAVHLDIQDSLLSSGRTPDILAVVAEVLPDVEVPFGGQVEVACIVRNHLDLQVGIPDNAVAAVEVDSCLQDHQVEVVRIGHVEDIRLVDWAQEAGAGSPHLMDVADIPMVEVVRQVLEEAESNQDKDQVGLWADHSPDMMLVDTPG